MPGPARKGGLGHGNKKVGCSLSTRPSHLNQISLYLVDVDGEELERWLLFLSHEFKKAYWTPLSMDVFDNDVETH